MDKGRLYSGMFIMVGLVVLGLMIPRAVGKYRSYDRTVNVKGLCEKEHNWVYGDCYPAYGF